MTLVAYGRRIAFEYVLVVLASACLTMVVLQGFVVAADVQFNIPLVVGLCCLCQIVLYGGAYRRSWAPWAVVVYGVLCAAVVGVGIATSAAPDPMADVEENHLAFCAVLVVVNALMYGLSRRSGAFVVLVAMVLFSCAFVQYVYHAGLVVPTLGCAGCLAALWVLRAYALSMQAAHEAGRPAFGAAALTAVTAAVVATILACLVYALIIAPLNPGHLTVKLFTEYRSFETVEVRNPSEVVVVEDPTSTTVTLTDEVVYGSIPVQLDANDPALAELDDFVQDSREQSGSKNVFRLEMVDEGGVYLYTYELPAFWWLLLAVIPVVAVVLAVCIRKVLRARWRTRTAALAPRDQVGALYTRLVRNFGKLGYGKAAGQTPAEYAQANGERLAIFSQEGYGWAALTELYERCHYGAAEPTNNELEQAWRLYDGQFARVVRVKGRFAYCFSYFWIL